MRNSEFTGQLRDSYDLDRLEEGVIHGVELWDQFLPIDKEFSLPSPELRSRHG